MMVAHRVFRPYQAVLGLVGLCALACTGVAEPPGSQPNGQTGGSANVGGSAGASGGGTNMPQDLTNGGPKLRVLTQLEYKNALRDLLGVDASTLKLPDDTFTDGFSTIGGALVAINGRSVELYETASRTAAAEVFADAARWKALVGCEPQANLSDACVADFIKSFGKRAFRRELTQVEVDQWLAVGKETAELAQSAAPGLAGIVSGLLQSPHFLYRVEVNQRDVASGRLKYDGASMATRLAFLLTGSLPSEALLAAAAAGQLDTAEGVKTAAANLLNDPGQANRLDPMVAFFSEFSQARLVSFVEKDSEMYPSWNAQLAGSMLKATELFIKDIVLAPGADVRSFFTSDKTFVDANLAPIYGVSPPASGFAQITLGPETGRAGILGQAGVLAGHSQADHNSPTRRGLFVAQTFLCQQPLVPPDGVITQLPHDPTLTTRQRLDLHRTNASCGACHAVFDPYGFALEHFDSIGKWRDTEDGLPIDATGELDGVPFDGAAQLSAALAGNERALTCMVSHFYRAANGVLDATADAAQIEALRQTLTSKNYVWRDVVLEFVASDAFRSAPAAAVTAGSQ